MMFTRTNKLQYNAKPESPDPLMARRLQESLGGQWGEMTGMMAYLTQGWSAVGHEDYKDLLLDTGTEEIGHVEMLATMIGHLLKDAPTDVQENAYNSGDPALAAIMGGMDPNQAIVSGLSASLNNPNGTPWNSSYTASSGNLLADMRYNVIRESMGRLQVTRLYHMTKDKGIRDMLSYLMARETQHQLQFIQAQEELEEKYGVVVPHGTKDLQHTEFSHTLMNFSEGEASREFLEGKTAKDGEKFKYDENPVAQGQEQETPPAPEALRNTQGDKEKTVEQGRKIIEQQQNME